MPSADTFAYRDLELPYCRAEYNHSGLNERAVEVPIAQWFVGQWGGREGLEVGNVLSHYGPVGHPVLDRYEDGVTHQIDVFEFCEPVDWVVSVSTLEHVRWDEAATERLPDGSVRALEHLLGLLRPGGAMLVTVPFGWQPFFDSAIVDGRLPREPVHQCTLLRVPTDPVRWVTLEGAVHRRYAASSIWAESVWVAEFVR